MFSYSAFTLLSGPLETTEALRAVPGKFNPGLKLSTILGLKNESGYVFKSLLLQSSCMPSPRRGSVEQERTDLRLFRLFTAHTTAFSPRTSSGGWSNMHQRVRLIKESGRFRRNSCNTNSRAVGRESR